MSAVHQPRRGWRGLTNPWQVSNISDAAYLGPTRTLAILTPLLRSPAENPKATIITLFMNAIDETLTDDDRMRDMTTNSASTKRLMQLIPRRGVSLSEYDPTLMKFIQGRALLTDFEDIFSR